MSIPSETPDTTLVTYRPEFREAFERLNREFQKTIIMVTHDPHAAERAQRVLHLDKGVLSN